MKKLISLALAAIMLAAALASCSVPSATDAASGAISPNVRLTSSDATDAAAWLTARLGERLTDRVAIGTEADGYGVDLSALENDGYIIRDLGDEVALFARTTDGLEGAVRRFAKSVEAGEAICDVIFHEGYRIEKLLLAGNDISTYAITVECENGYDRRFVTEHVAGTLSRLFGVACGFAPEVGGEAEHRIVLRQVEDESFKDSSYNYHFENGDLVIGFSGIYGAKNGALMFLDDECGWTDLAFGYDVLEEADLIDVPADLDKTVHPTLEGGFCQCIRTDRSTLFHLDPTLADNGYKIPSAHHALGETWAKYYSKKNFGHYPCLTDEDVILTCVEEIVEHIEKRVAAGEKLGEDIFHIDLGMEDGDGNGTTFCKCKNCTAVYIEEGAAWAGPMIRFANAVEEAVDEAGYDGIKYSVFAYAGSNMPPKKTAPNDDLYITLVLHDSCDLHYIDGSQCTGSVGVGVMREYNRSYSGGRRILNNEDWGQWIDGWNDLGAHLYIRVATLTKPFTPFMTMYVQYENMKYFAERGVMAIYNESYSIDGFDFNHIVGELYQILHYRPGISRAEYYAEYYRLLEKYYGDGWKNVLAFSDMLRDAELEHSCSTAWGVGITHYDFGTILSRFDEALTLLDEALAAASSALEVYYCTAAKCIALYLGCKITASVYGTQGEEFEAAAARWEEMIALLEKIGYPIIDASEITVTSYVANLGAYGNRSGNVIFFPYEKVCIWPLAVRIEPTLEAEHEINRVDAPSDPLY